MGLLASLIRSVDDLVSQGYPREVAERIVSGELPMDFESRMARANEMGFDVANPEYHGTHSNIFEVDPGRVDLGLHTGTYEQANNRLQDTRYGLLGGSRVGNQYRTGANIIPTLLRRGNEITEMRDIGAWNQSPNVADELNNLGYDVADLLQEMDTERRLYEDAQDFIDSVENRQALDEMRDILLDDGYDSIRYENVVENSLGGSSNLTKEAQKQMDELFRKESEITTAMELRRPSGPDLPDPSDPDAATKIDEWRAFHSRPDTDFYTQEEIKALDDLRAQRMAIGGNPASYNDTRSTISMRPENVRSYLSAAFDPKYTGPNILGQYALPVAAAGLLAAPGEAEAGVRNYFDRSAVEPAAKEVARRFRDLGFDVGDIRTSTTDFGVSSYVPVSYIKDLPDGGKRWVANDIRVSDHGVGPTRHMEHFHVQNLADIDSAVETFSKHKAELDAYAESLGTKTLEQGYATPSLLGATAATGLLGSELAPDIQAALEEAGVIGDKIVPTKKPLGERAMGIVDRILTGLEVPQRGIQGLSRAGYGLLSGEGLDTALSRGADVVNQGVEETARQLGDYVFDKTGSPELATGAYMTGILSSPL